MGLYVLLTSWGGPPAAAVRKRKQGPNKQLAVWNRTERNLSGGWSRVPVDTQPVYQLKEAGT